ncbi:MAG: hypothetical protein J6C78_09775 [Muribaculaceae bacterium]|nr:hypothetical protein [Muribaculaceae bacterium]
MLFGIGIIHAKEKEITIKLKICNDLNRRQVINPSVEIFKLSTNGDSTKITHMTSRYDNGRLREITFDGCAGRYAIRISVDEAKVVAMDDSERRLKSQSDLEPRRIIVDVAEGVDKIELSTIFMSRKRKEIALNEVSVTASKVMFYHKGDTLIFNADAFILAEGSTLDGLLKQMPGVELKKDGVITVNGKKVSELLINGKDLFNGQRQLMLKNIGAYMVKNIKTYDKQGRRSKLMGRDMNDSRYVMDVTLKRQYSMGWIVNASGGYGTHRRYSVKLFGMWFSDNVSVATHFTSNNLNDDSTPGEEDGSLTPEAALGGMKSIKAGGITYFATGSGDKWELKGSVNAKKLNNDMSTFENTENYLDNGNTYKYTWADTKERSWQIETRHNWFVKLRDNVDFTASPNFSYRNQRNTGGLTSALFDEKMSEISREAVESIYDGGSAVDTLVTRKISETLDRRNCLSANIDLKSDIRLGKSDDMLTAQLNGKYTGDKSDRFDRFKINGHTDPVPYDVQYQHLKGHPNREWNGMASLSYNRKLNKDIKLNIKYAYDIEHDTKTSYLYQLEKIANDLPLGVLPSNKEYLSHINGNQSYDTRFSKNSHEIEPEIDMNLKIGGHALSINAAIPFSITHRAFRYNGLVHKAPKLKQWNSLAGLSLNTSTYIGKTSLSINFISQPIMQDMLSMIDVVNDTDPLNVRLGNPDLKIARSNVAFAYATFSSNNYLTSNTFMVQFQSIDNAFAQGAVYNPTSGITYYRPYNVDGNRSFDLSHTFNTNFGKSNRFGLSAKTIGKYVRSIDLAGSADVTDADYAIMPPRRRVATHTLGEEFKMSWQTGRHRLSAHADVRVNRYTSSDEGFTDFTSWTAKYGASGVLNLPMNWGLSTDLTLYTRRGFTDRQLNTTDLVWNARATKSILNGSVVFVVDAYDLLRQLTNVTYTINAQARTETVSNVIPAYVLFHIQYRWNKQPKKGR